MGEKKKEGKRKETRKERERGTTKYRIRGRRIIDESSTNKRNQRDEVHQDLHARARAHAFRTLYIYIHTYARGKNTTKRRVADFSNRTRESS